ncbi:MAG: thrombospondin type 3 repeat-containing protein, partial [bacterium]
ADGDGLSNLQEMAAGTHPGGLAGVVAGRDSDGDGVWDGVELQAGTDPRSTNSVPGTNQVYMLPAIELGYVPQTMGVTQQFQYVNKMGMPAAWTNLGSSFVSSNAWFYQLMSTREVTQKFFRVITNP